MADTSREKKECKECAFYLLITAARTFCRRKTLKCFVTSLLAVPSVVSVPQFCYPFLAVLLLFYKPLPSLVVQFLTSFTLMLFTVLLRVNTYQSSCSNQSFEANFVGCLVYRMFLRFFFFYFSWHPLYRVLLLAVPLCGRPESPKNLLFPKRSEPRLASTLNKRFS